MSTLETLRKKIELVRNELNEQIVSKDYEVYYAKSLELDKLIEEYIDLEEGLTA